MHLLLGILKVCHVSFSCTCSLGRRPAFFIYLFIECFFGVATAFAQDFVTWSVFRFGVGFTVPAILGTPYVLGECCLIRSYSSALQQQRSGECEQSVHTLWWHTLECSFVTGYQKRAVFPAPVFAKPWMFDSTCAYLFHPNRKINVEIMDRNFAASFGKVGFSLRRFSRNFAVARSSEGRNLYRNLSESGEKGNKIRLISVYSLK